ncbi:AAA family ATPase [Geothermobacter hydrogeniphilus]|uniref:AAA family ATPase n=1 Tax=Geothermobacter hydrogeniphilus TaxID=1969733 RepID=UPI001304B8DC|nr:ATP-binding protein [Geothermobacter hydrogeniphilus]
MLKKLTIKGFKSIVNESLEFGRVNLFLGPNGAGKSNVLEAIGVMGAALGRDITDAELQRKGVRLSVPTLFKSSFKNRTLRINFDLEAVMSRSVSYDVRITASESSQSLRFFTEHIVHKNITYMGRSNHGITLRGDLEPRKDVSPDRGLWDRFRELIDCPEDLSDELNKLSKFSIYAPQTTFLRGTDVESVPVRPVGLLGGGLPQAAAAVLMNPVLKSSEVRELVDDILGLVWMPGWANQFEIAPADPAIVSSQVRTAEQTLYFRDKFMKRGRDMLSAYDSSEGTLYLLFLAVLALHPEAPKIFALDNVDNALNPAVTRVLLEKLISLTCESKYREFGIGPEQVFMTSHNPTSLDAFDIFDDNQRIFVVSREKDTGYTKVERLLPSENMTRSDWIRIAKGKNLSEMLISGMIKNALGDTDL